MDTIGMDQNEIVCHREGYKNMPYESHAIGIWDIPVTGRDITGYILLQT